MYFINLRYLKKYNFDEELLNALDKLLVHYHSTSELFTPMRVCTKLNISKDLAYQLLLNARDVGVLNTVFVKKCSYCKRIYRYKYDIKSCSRCNGSDFKEGYFFTTDRYQNQLVCN